MTIVWWVLGIALAMFLLTALRGAPYVPSRSRDIERVFDELYTIGEGDLLVDIGSGDGKVCLAAARRGARAVGYEINPLLVIVAKFRAHGKDGVRFLWRDFWHTDLPEQVSIVYTFGDARDIERMATHVEQQATKLDRSIYFLSYAFQLQTRQPLRKNSLYFLYEIAPTLQSEKP